MTNGPITPGLWIASLVALAVLNLLLLAWLAFRKRPDDAAAQAAAQAAAAQAAAAAAAATALAALREQTERSSRELRAEMQESSRAGRQELQQTLALFQQTLLSQGGDVARTQNEQIDSFRTQLGALQQAVGDALQRFSLQMGEQQRLLADAQERRMGELRLAVEARLAQLQEGNEKKLEQMRATVDEKLHATLEHRLGESFKQVAERLEQVHRGLGDMQVLARDVGSLNRVLTNVKSRGIFGEVQLAGLLEQVFTPEQYATNVAVVPGRGERVEFAIKLPGTQAEGAEARPLWLPIDAKFPREDHERLLDAQERGDAEAAAAAGKAIEARLRMEAAKIRDKYVEPPYTTDFGILFLPSEGLYAEALRRPGLVEGLQRECKVMLAGPTTLLALLTSLQMGFRTLALEKRSAEVWEVLGAVKTEFSKFGAVLARVKDQTGTVLRTLEQAETRTRQMTRALKGVEALPENRALQLIPALPSADDEDAVG